MPHRDALGINQLARITVEPQAIRETPFQRRRGDSAFAYAIVWSDLLKEQTDDYKF